MCICVCIVAKVTRRWSSGNVDSLSKVKSLRDVFQLMRRKQPTEPFVARALNALDRAGLRVACAAACPPPLTRLCCCFRIEWSTSWPAGRTRERTARLELVRSTSLPIARSRHALGVVDETGCATPFSQSCLAPFSSAFLCLLFDAAVCDR